ncbi:DUF4291 family protein [Streptomyces sp. NPDC007903]|uniref:DUF4291 family protein n=1 Tax=Streptomyces sp. NPDC007903 TaxID=3364786 RepID=UPI0036EB5520
MPHRSLRPGLTGEAAARYADEWIVGIRDVTPPAREVHGRYGPRGRRRRGHCRRKERPYPVAEALLTHLGA